MGWFDGQATKEKRVAVKNAILVMMADGRIDKRELAFLLQVCKRVGVSEKEMKKLLDSLKDVKFTVPKSNDERIRQLMDMVFMMMVDGEIDNREMAVCLDLGKHLGFPPAMVGTIVKSVAAAIQGGRSRAEVAVEVGSYLGK